VKLTPIEIKNQEFKKGMRGYDPVEVTSYLEFIADKYHALLEENEALAKKNLILETELSNHRGVESTLKQTLQNVQENSQISKENSAKEAGLIKKEAELAAAQMLEQSRLKVHKMKEEIVGLQNQKHSLVSRLRHLLSSQMELLDVLEIDDLDIKKLKDRTKPGARVVVPIKTSTPVKRNSPSAPAPLQAVKKAAPPVASAAPIEKKPITPQKVEPEDEENIEKTHGEDLFNDIFGRNLDVDDFKDRKSVV